MTPGGDEMADAMRGIVLVCFAAILGLVGWIIVGEGCKSAGAAERLVIAETPVDPAPPRYWLSECQGLAALRQALDIDGAKVIRARRAGKRVDVLLRLGRSRAWATGHVLGSREGYQWIAWYGPARLRTWLAAQPECRRVISWRDAYELANPLGAWIRADATCHSARKSWPCAVPTGDTPEGIGPGVEIGARSHEAAEIGAVP
jgi:hypothetical protein